MTVPLVGDAPQQRSAPATGWNLPKPANSTAARPARRTVTHPEGYAGKYARQPAASARAGTETGSRAAAASTTPTAQARHAVPAPVTQQQATLARNEAAIGWVACVFAVIAFGFELIVFTAALLRPDNFILIIGSAAAAIASVAAAVWIVDP